MGAAFKVLNSKNIILENVSTAKPIKDTPVIKLDHASNIMINNNFQMYPTDVFLEANGAGTKSIFLKNNVFEHVKTIVKKGKDLHLEIKTN
jgi:hypothetical protein